MKIFPAVDILGGKAVRLTRGAYDSAKTYFDDPVRAASLMREAGAEYLHVVDLDGARSGRTDNFSLIERIVKQTSLKVEVGGGVRDTERVKAYLDSGAFRVILGTSAVKNYPFVLAAASAFPGRIAVGVDAKDGFVAVSGWEESTGVRGVEFCEKLAGDGICDVIYTDVACDGAMAGTNLDVYRELVKIRGLRVVASGGVKDMDEIAELEKMGADGVILGKALYEGALDLKKVTAAFGKCSQSE